MGGLVQAGDLRLRDFSTLASTSGPVPFQSPWGGGHCLEAVEIPQLGFVQLPQGRILRVGDSGHRSWNG